MLFQILSHVQYYAKCTICTQKIVSQIHQQSNEGQTRAKISSSVNF